MVRTYLPEAIKLVLMKEVLEMLGREDCSRREEKSSGIGGGHREECSCFCSHSSPGSPGYCSSAEQDYSLWDTGIMSKKQERSLTLLLFNCGIGDITIRKKSFHLPRKSWLCSGQSFFSRSFPGDYICPMGDIPSSA